MSILLSLVGFVVFAVVLFFGFQVYLLRKMHGQKGKPAPKLAGSAGRWIEGGKAALFYFYSPSCGACRLMTPTVKGLAKQRQGVFPVDISRDMDTARRFGVMATPTTVLVDKGVIRDILVGPQPPATLEQLTSPMAAPGR